MRIQKQYEMPKPEVEGPHEHYGRLVCQEETASEQQYLAGFAENIWSQAGGDDHVVAFVPGMSLTAFWINAKTRATVTELIDETARMISSGLSNVEEVSDLI